MEKEEEFVPVTWVSRTEWGAKRPKWITGLELPVGKIAVTFTETEPCKTDLECISRIRELQDKHLEEPNEPDIKHNFLISSHGVVYEGRGFTRVGPTYKETEKRLQDLNLTSLDMAFIGWSSQDTANAAVRAMSNCVAEGVRRGHVTQDFTNYYVVFEDIRHIQTAEDRRKAMQPENPKLEDK